MARCLKQEHSQLTILKKSSKTFLFKAVIINIGTIHIYYRAHKMSCFERCLILRFRNLQKNIDLNESYTYHGVLYLLLSKFDKISSRFP